MKRSIHFYFLLKDQWFNLTAHDMRSTLVNAVLEHHRSHATPGTPMSPVTSPSSSTPMRSPIHIELPSFPIHIELPSFQKGY